MANRVIYFTLGFCLVIYCYSHSVMGLDQYPFKDFCVADIQSKVMMNGFACKDPKVISAEDFFFAGLGQQGNTNNVEGFNVTAANAIQLPGLNSLGISLIRIDYAVGGVNPPHTHPTATEVLFVLEGTLFVGFTDTTDNFFRKTLNTGELFVFPAGLVHFQQNVGKGTAAAIAALTSDLPGVQVIANTLFQTRPTIPNSILSYAFRISEKLVDYIKDRFN